MTFDSQLLFETLIRVHIGTDCGVLDALNQAESEELERDPKSNVPISHRLVEVWLREDTVRRVRAPLEGKQAVNTTVPSAVPIELETDFPKRSIRFLEGWNDVGSSKPMGHHVGGVLSWRATADRRLEVADETLIGIENWAHAGGVDQRKWRKRVLRIRIDRENVLRLLRTGIAGTFEFGNTEKALIEESDFIVI
jgi:hypothetical protein